MPEDDRLRRVLEDLEQQAEGMALAERDAELAEQRRAEYAQVDLASRWHASLDTHVVVEVLGVGVVEGDLARVGTDWVLLEAATQQWVVPLGAVVSVRGLADRARSPETRGISSRLGMAAALRRVVESRLDVVAHLRDGRALRGRPTRVGADFWELRVGDGAHATVEVVPVGALAAVRTGEPGPVGRPARPPG